MRSRPVARPASALVVAELLQHGHWNRQPPAPLLVAVERVERPEDVHGALVYTRKLRACKTLERQLAALDLQQQVLALQAAGVAAEAARRVQDAVAGDDDGDRVGAQRVAGGA